MGVKRQQGVGDQRDLFDEALKALARHGATGEGGTGAGACGERQAPTAWDRNRALTQRLMEEVASSANLEQAYRRVRANQGAPGCDGMSVADLPAWTAENRDGLIVSLLDGSYRPQPVRGVEIPKPGGGVRQLGIPVPGLDPGIVDRLVQQAIAQVLEPILDPTFSSSSFGFRPGRGAHDALHQARDYVADGYGIVVDIDLEAFFDRVQHDVLLARLARRIGDKRVLRLVRRFLQAGLMHGGLCSPRHEGMPQGGPLSPLLSNLLLDDLDKELDRRGHRFCRYADDCNIYVRTRSAGERVMASITAFLEGRLRLRVNRQKSAVAPVGERQFLGYRLDGTGRLTLPKKSLKRAKDRLRRITRRNRSVPLEHVIAEVNRFTQGWATYFRHLHGATPLRDVDKWVRRKLRCLRLKHCKNARTVAAFLKSRGVPDGRVRMVAGSNRGWWHKSRGAAAQEAMSIAWFRTLGLVGLADRHAALNPAGNRRGTRSVCPVV